MNNFIKILYKIENELDLYKMRRAEKERMYHSALTTINGDGLYKIELQLEILVLENMINFLESILKEFNEDGAGTVRAIEYDNGRVLK